jgi:hypothetical protein
MRSLSRGYKVDPPALIHPNIMIGAGEMLTPAFQAKYKITHVINCAFEQDSPSWFKEKFSKNYFCVGAFDSYDVNILDWYPAFKTTLRTFLQDPTCGRVFVHCQCGINRSMFLALMYVCDVFKFPFAKTETSLIRQRPCCMTNTVFRQQVFDALSKDG